MGWPTASASTKRCRSSPCCDSRWSLGATSVRPFACSAPRMRDKRLLRAEEVANKLSVKMVLPLGMFIFPVILVMVMLPVVIKLMVVMK